MLTELSSAQSNRQIKEYLGSAKNLRWKNTKGANVDTGTIAKLVDKKSWGAVGFKSCTGLVIASKSLTPEVEARFACD